MCAVMVPNLPSERAHKVILVGEPLGRINFLTKLSRCAVWHVLAVIFVAWSVLPVSAQLTRGFISGIVSDSSSAILAGVQVTITNTATNISRDTITNDAGFYRFSAVEPGDYTAEFKLEGFEGRRVRSVTVNTAQE